MVVVLMAAVGARRQQRQDKTRKARVVVEEGRRIRVFFLLCKYSGVCNDVNVEI